MAASAGRRGPSKGDQRELALIDAARKLLREKPIGRVTIDELATAAGIARPGFYFYFDSKQSVLAALCDKVIGEGETDMAEWIAAAGPARAALRAGLANSLARWRVDGLWLSEALTGPTPDSGLRKIREQIMNFGESQLGERIEAERTAGRSDIANAAVTARMILTLRNAFYAEVIAGAASGDANAAPRVSDDELVDALTDTILRIIYGQIPVE